MRLIIQRVLLSLTESRKHLESRQYLGSSAGSHILPSDKIVWRNITEISPQSLFKMSDHVCLTGCAHTYREARQLIKEKERLRRESQAHEELIKERKPKSFCISKLGPVLPDPLEGTYRQFQLENYDSYMEALGAGKMSRNMILRSTVVLQINEVIIDHRDIHLVQRLKCNLISSKPTSVSQSEVSQSCNTM